MIGSADDARRVTNQRPTRVTDPRCSLDRAVAGQRAKRQHAIVRPDVAEVCGGVDVDEDPGTREAETHRGNQRLAAGQHAGFRAMFHEMRERLVGGMGPEVLEGCGYHRNNLLLERADTSGG